MDVFKGQESWLGMDIAMRVDSKTAFLKAMEHSYTMVLLSSENLH